MVKTHFESLHFNRFVRILLNHREILNGTVHASMGGCGFFFSVCKCLFMLCGSEVVQQHNFSSDSHFAQTFLELFITRTGLQKQKRCRCLETKWIHITRGRGNERAHTENYVIYIMTLYTPFTTYYSPFTIHIGIGIEILTEAKTVKQFYQNLNEYVWCGVLCCVLMRIYKWKQKYYQTPNPSLVFVYVYLAIHKTCKNPRKSENSTKLQTLIVIISQPSPV